jgi:hypothetical protein
MVDGLQGDCVILKLTQIIVMPRGMACAFPRRLQGQKLILGGDLCPGLLAALLGACGYALQIAQAETL